MFKGRPTVPLPTAVSFVLFSFVLFSFMPLRAQQALAPGFRPSEYLSLLEMAQYQNKGLFPVDTGSATLSRRPSPIPEPRDYQLVYRSREMGLYNQWDLWLKKDSSVAVVCIRGTISKTESWMENFYAAMIPASGTLTLNDSTRFRYQLATSPRAAVHTGWVIGLAYLAPSVLRQIYICQRLGISQFIIFGHSQGGAIAFLLSSYLHYLPDSILSDTLRFKTYCSAAPKPGNLYYAYDFDYMTRGGWAFRVVNTTDWVPETPFSMQTLQDFNHPNPFTKVKPALKRAKLIVRLYAGHLFNRMDRSSEKTSKRFRRVLGKTVFKQIHRVLPGLVEPAYAHSVNYMPAGAPVILAPYPGYDAQFPYRGTNDFVHHGLDAYYQLVLHDYPGLEP